MSLRPPEKVRKLQRTLHAKAKESPDYRFYALYDKVYREDILHYAYRCCKANGGAAGVDGETFADIESYGRDRWLDELSEAVRSKSYRVSPIGRVYIPKPNGKQRPLGIPTVKDRVVQTAAMLVLEPIFEADLPVQQYAYRPKRSAHDAIRAVHTLVNRGHTQVIDADLSGYFDTIPHAELMKSVARRSKRPTSGAGNVGARRTRIREGGHRKAPPSPHCWRTCICVDSFWDGSFWDISNA